MSVIETEPRGGDYGYDYYGQYPNIVLNEPDQ